MSKPKILLQLDTDRHASVFDSVVAVDAGVDVLLPHSRVMPDDVPGLVHGAMFTRGTEDLRSTAIFVGGSEVAVGEAVLERIRRTFFGPVRVSVMIDSNGANTTAAAAVLAVSRHVELSEATVMVLGGTGPVGQRAARLLAGKGATVRVGSRTVERAMSVCTEIAGKSLGVQITPHATATAEETAAALTGVQAVICAGAAGVQLLSKEVRSHAKSVTVAIDLNAVPPAGIEGVDVMDRGAQREGMICYGAVGVGGTKMKIHKAAIDRLFQANDQVLDAEEIYEIGRQIAG